MNQLMNINQSLTMSSREIATLCKKEHGHVKRDIESMFKELEIDVSKFGRIYKDSMNREKIEYLLDKENSLILVSGYNVKIRQAIIKRWQELESQQNNKVNYETALAVLGVLLDSIPVIAQAYYQRDEAIKTKAYIGDKKTATAMNTASQLSKQLDKAKDFATVKRVEKATGQKYKWKPLKDYSVENKFPVNKVFDANYGDINSYHADAWYEVYGVDIFELK